MSSGWITLHRKIQKSSWYGNPDYVALFVHMLLRANHKPKNVVMGNQIIALERGQFIAGRKVLAAETGIQESKVTRIISVFKTEQQIEQESYSRFSVFTVLNYDTHQNIEQQSEQQVNSKRTASEQQVNTNNNVNNVNNVIKKSARFTKPTLQELQDYCVQKNLSVDCNNFINHYESNGWKVGRNSMKSWQAALSQWSSRDNKQLQHNKTQSKGNYGTAVEWLESK